MKQMQGFRWKGQIVENRYYLENQVRKDSGIREHGHLCGRFQGDKYYLEGQMRGNRRYLQGRMKEIGAEDRCYLQRTAVTCRGRYKKTNVTWRSRRGELKGEHGCDRCVYRQVWVKGVT